MKTIVVLGMHHSATSLVAEGLERAGAWMYGPHGTRCHWEDMSFACMNEQILKAAGGSWKSPPDHQDIIRAGDDFKDVIQDLCRAKREGAEREGRLFWGWKDPRTCLTFELYRPYLENCHLVPIFRDPTEVAMSLVRARKINTIEWGERLARIYNRRIIDILSRGMGPKGTCLW